MEVLTCLDDFSDATLKMTKSGSSLLYIPVLSLAFKMRKIDDSILSTKGLNC